MRTLSCATVLVHPEPIKEFVMLDPQTQALLNLIEEKGVPATHLLSPSEARKMYLERRFFSQPPAPELAAVNDISIPSEPGQRSIKARTRCIFR